MQFYGTAEVILDVYDDMLVEALVDGGYEPENGFDEDRDASDYELEEFNEADILEVAEYLVEVEYASFDLACAAGDINEIHSLGTM